MLFLETSKSLFFKYSLFCMAPRLSDEYLWSLTLAMSNFKISTKYFGMHIRIVYNPQSTVKLAIITAQTGREVIIEHHGTLSCYKKNFPYKLTTNLLAVLHLYWSR